MQNFHPRFSRVHEKLLTRAQRSGCSSKWENLDGNLRTNKRKIFHCKAEWTEWNCNLNNQHVQDSQKLNRDTNEMIFICSPSSRFFIVFIGLKYEDFNVMRHLLDVHSDDPTLLLPLPMTHWFFWPFVSRHQKSVYDYWNFLLSF